MRLHFWQSVNLAYTATAAIRNSSFPRLQDERIAAFKEYAADVKGGRFPEARHLVEMDDATFKKAVEAIEGK